MLELWKIEELVNAHLRKRLGPFGFEHASIRVGKDHDGDETIFVVARYKPNSPSLDALASLSGATEINQILNREGDERFVHLTHTWPDEAPVDETDKPRRRSGARA